MDDAELDAAVRSTLQRLKYIDASGQLIVLDSLTTIDAVTALEESLGMSIPSAWLQREVFASVDSIVSMLRELRSAG